MTDKARLLARLSDGCWHSYMELYELHMIVHSRVSDLRRDGYLIECDKREKNYRYRLKGRTLNETADEPTSPAVSLSVQGPSLSRDDVSNTQQQDTGTGAQLSLGVAWAS